MKLNYWIRATRSLGQNLIADLLHPGERQFEFTRSWLSHGLSYDQGPALLAPGVKWWDLCPQASSINLPMRIQYRYGNVSPLELYCMASIAALRKATRIFEIGTFDGATPLAFAAACPKSQVFTLELPHGLEHSATANSGDGAILTGSRFHGTPEEERITQLYADSTRFDFTPYYGTCDVVFIDGGHDYQTVHSDSRHTLRLLRPVGVIIWHDYIPMWPGVKRAVEELLPRYPIVYIQDTCLAVLDRSDVMRECVKGDQVALA